MISENSSRLMAPSRLSSQVSRIRRTCSTVLKQHMNMNMSSMHGTRGSETAASTRQERVRNAYGASNASIR